MKCDRCGNETKSWKMSIFNTDMLCPECLAKEENHPMYKHAKEVEFMHVKMGDYNFEGVGKPADL